MTQNSLQTHYELLHSPHRDTADEQSKDRESHKQAMPQEFLLWARILSLKIQFALATQIYGKYQSRGKC